MTKYEIIVNKIKDSYLNNYFDPNIYRFYEGRKTKKSCRAGIIKYEDEQYFFKILEKEEYNDESNIRKLVGENFTTVDKLETLELERDIISLYKYIDAPKINTYNTLRSDSLTLKEKENLLNNFFTNIIDIQKKYLKKDIMKGDKKSDRWFYTRIMIGDRITMYYEENFKKLLNDINKLTPSFKDNFIKFFKDVYEYLKEENYTLFTYSHGDFHDFNFTLNGLYWDIDTFDFNPILNDFIIYYWHFYAREDSIIYNHSPWLVPLMYNKLNINELNEVRELKQKQILRWFKEIKSYFNEYNLDLNKEFVYKIFCRIFLIDDVTIYNEDERINVYTYFNYLLEHQKEDIETLLFNNPAKFDIKEKAS